ncbi:hypothetical protein ACRAWG_11305 [Methylobacterium sp. P31]
MLDLDDHDLEHSPLSGPVTRDGIPVEVEIYRFAETQDPWRLEVADQKGRCTAWQQGFATEQYAYRTFCEKVADDGIGSFAEPQPTRLHGPRPRLVEEVKAGRSSFL